MVSHLTEQQYDLVGKPESVSILLCSSWRSSQSPYVPFEVEQFKFFSLTARSRFAKRKGSSKVWKEKGLQVILSLILSLTFLFLFLHYLCVVLSCFKSVLFYALLCLTCFCLFTFRFCFILFFI